MVFSLVLLVIGALLAAFVGSSPFIGGAIGFLMGWVYSLSLRIHQLEIQLKHSASAQEALVASEPILDQLQPVTPPSQVSVPPQVYAPAVEADSLINAEPVQPQAASQAYFAEEPQPPKFSVLSKAKDWLVGGNPFVRLGVVILFIGVVFLLRYSIQHNLVPVEIRLIAAAIGALVLLGFGWKLRERAGAYGLILQAGGIGLLYLTVFGAYSLYHLIPSLAAFALLLLFVLAATALAVLQNSLALAVFATVGGFLAPLLTSSGSNNYIGLFSFYALLNAGIVTIAWFKSWRLLNLVGFVFTFVIAGIWGWFSYRPEDFWPTEGFLILFFLFYVLIAILFATRRPFNLKDKVDGSLVFGTPIIGFCLQAALFVPFASETIPSSFLTTYGLAVSSLVLSLFYLGLAWLVWKRYGQEQKLLAETFLVLGVIFATLTIPFAAQNAAITTAAWAIEGAGIVWLGIHQRQFIQRLVAVMLQFVSLLLLIGSFTQLWWMYPVFWDTATVQAFSNGFFVASSLVALAMLLSSRLLANEFEGKRSVEQGLAISLLISAVVMHFISFEIQVIWGEFDYALHWHLVYAAIVSGLLWLSARTYWPLLSWVLPLPMLLLALALLISLTKQTSIFTDYALLAWLGFFAVWYGLLGHLERQAWFPLWLKVAHSFSLWIIVFLLTDQLQLLLSTYFTWQSAWSVAALPVVALVTVWLVLKAPIWPFKAQTSLFYSLAIPLLGLVAWWFLMSLAHAGSVEPLPWLPLLNPLDLVTLWMVLTLVQLVRHWQQLGGLKDSMFLRYSLIFIGFVWLNLTILRVLHHWYGLAWEFPSLLLNPVTQTTLALVWGLSGLLLTWRGNRIGKRVLWSAGAALLAAVVLKLFLIDFASSDTVERIISFIGVGVLLLFIGYLAPLPPAHQETIRVK
ncbi:MAG: DUF2339 domain-containing protein [Thiothrix sp.]|nr:MAG: DUF2339 domain-containing protein [Thiothrix sp.]